jgi:hypothetical protein
MRGITEFELIIHYEDDNETNQDELFERNITQTLEYIMKKYSKKTKYAV